jgi:hypothetical protein
VKVGKSTPQLFKMIARRYPEILIGDGVIDHLKSTKQPMFEICRDEARPHIIHVERPQPSVAKSYDHHHAPLEVMYQSMVHTATYWATVSSFALASPAVVHSNSGS